jgi:hypothetical protein
MYNEICTICFSDIDINDIPDNNDTELECRHIFHTKCINNITKCPLCRKKIVTNNYHYHYNYNDSESEKVQPINKCLFYIYIYTIAFSLLGILVGMFVLFNKI